MANSTQQSRNIFEYNLDLRNRLWDNISSLANATRTSGHNTLSLLHNNVKSLMNKLYFYESLNLSNSIDIFSISETWLKPEIPNSLWTSPALILSDVTENRPQKHVAVGQLSI